MSTLLRAPCADWELGLHGHPVRGRAGVWAANLPFMCDGHCSLRSAHQWRRQGSRAFPAARYPRHTEAARRVLCGCWHLGFRSRRSREARWHLSTVMVHAQGLACSPVNPGRSSAVEVAGSRRWGGAAAALAKGMPHSLLTSRLGVGSFGQAGQLSRTKCFDTMGYQAQNRRD